MVFWRSEVKLLFLHMFGVCQGKEYTVLEEKVLGIRRVKRF